MCLQVVVLERTWEAGKKVLMSGGTRCNVLPLEADLSVGSIAAFCLQLQPAEGAESRAACLTAACGMCSRAHTLASWLKGPQAVLSTLAASTVPAAAAALGSQIPCVCRTSCLQTDYFTSSSRSALRAVFSSWTLEECHEWLSTDVGLRMVLEEETRKWFPASNSGREVGEGGTGRQADREGSSLQ